MEFTDRRDAGRELAARLHDLAGQRPLVLGLPRGGVVVAGPVAEALGGELDIIGVRKLGVPGDPELALGAIAEGGTIVANPDVLRHRRLGPADLERAAAEAFPELDKAVARLRRGRPPVSLEGRCVIVVDDGIATGATTRAALHSVASRGARLLTLAVPVAPADVLEELSSSADRTVCPNPRVWMRAVGNWYRDFRPVTDDEVMALLHPQHA
ncbi:MULTISPECIES: phosphoribosyltransferase [Prauserella salsuginis group]|uniref:Phosphoribosyltransferase n=2 Tax=Prauserella salsuginis group TaxID=2893672 RepID=A0ABW6G439_9PSEU|nr:MULTISPECIES: phosphoribosyltransferase family protein [Prauserella salsuginis group]MBB3664840.1 putative phosphoribosyl transferase [Prauserella sediminis]MCR3718310.1 putative phosphoribosyltransferase [Prauserella flava]MCR3732880.1 putative phosphoribosyltransferase [Prauserella salsuginis]